MLLRCSEPPTTYDCIGLNVLEEVRSEGILEFDYAIVRLPSAGDLSAGGEELLAEAAGPRLTPSNADEHAMGLRLAELAYAYLGDTWLEAVFPALDVASPSRDESTIFI